MSTNFSVDSPDKDFVLETYKFSFPLSQISNKSQAELDLLAKREVEKIVGDEIELKSLKIKMPGLFRSLASKVGKKQPMATFFVTAEF